MKHETLVEWQQAGEECLGETGHDHPIYKCPSTKGLEISLSSSFEAPANITDVSHN